MAKILHITAFLRDGKTLYRSHYPEADSIPDREWFPGYYKFHGKIRELGIDQGFAPNCEDFGCVEYELDCEWIEHGEVQSVHWGFKRRAMRLNGIVDVEVEGVSKPCKGYFWTKEAVVSFEGKRYPIWEQHGLVVYADDVEGNKDALEIYDKAERTIDAPICRTAS